MIDLKQFTGFAIDYSDTSPESKQIAVYCLVNDIEAKRFKRKDFIPSNYVPTGSVEFCERILGYHPMPDYYPDWASKYLFRKVWNSNEWILGERYFVKPSDRYKRFTGFVTKGTYSKKKKPPFVYSEIISFVNEWRYYVSAGKNKGGWWYCGNDEDKPAPDLNIDIPDDYFGALDMGETSTGLFALVESQHPFACGWYGSQQEVEVYMQWLIDGWEYMLDGS